MTAYNTDLAAKHASLCTCGAFLFYDDLPHTTECPLYNIDDDLAAHVITYYDLTAEDYPEFGGRLTCSD